jgi:hypothetical protein
MKHWTDAPFLYFHFNTANGCVASLPMRRNVLAFTHEFKGIPGTVKGHKHGSNWLLEPVWYVPGYQCLNCGKTYFSAERDGLKHECMNNGGIISASPSMGV